MGSVSLKIGDGTARFRRATLCSSALHLVMLVSVLTTNLFALYAFTYAPSASTSAGRHLHLLSSGRPENLSLISQHLALIVREIESSQKKLTQIEREILGYETLDLSKPGLPPELKLFLNRHPLPLGRDSRSGITEMVSSVGHSCARAADLLALYMAYKPGGQCRDDGPLAQKLVSRGCEPLPRRRCLSRPTPKLGLLPLPLSLWKPVNEKIAGSLSGGGFDRQMWVKPRGKNDFLIDDVLALGGGMRVGFDIGGGAGNFAARMAERNVTIVTSVLNVGGPASDFVAARGLFPLFLTSGQRFPFYDSVFDLVHTINGLDEGGAGATRPEKLEFLMFDIDRVLRPGGLFWLDNYYCADEKKKWALTVLIEKFGYKKLKWVVGEKVDPSGSWKKVYLSAVLQKPARG